MSNNIVKYRLEEKIRFLLLRHPKNLDRVCKEASEYAGRDVPVSVVTKVLEKFRKSQGKDVRLWVACNLAQQIIQGSQERLAKLEAMYQQWDGKEEALESVCCCAPVTKHEPADGSPPYYRCVKCNVVCGTAVVRALNLENLKLRLIKDMRQESAHMIKFAKEMGFVATTPEEPVNPPTSQNYIFVNNSDKPKKISSDMIIDAEMAQEAKDLPPMEREKLLRDLDSMLEEAENTSDTEEEVGSNG